ncbi:MAG TPA: TonB family protein [Candidatus Limnocylindria bacterium]|nr:TonB family protein [Candidatus Limnocylindria bacterium]HTL66736.1 TonB family protein [Lacunisphaera sp.]
MHLESGATGLLQRGLAGLLLGLAFTSALFFGLAHLEHAAPPAPEPEYSDLQSAALPIDLPPPPPPTVGPSAPEAPVVPILGGLGVDTGDVGAPVKITVSPREVSQLLPAHVIQPSMKALTQTNYTDLKPRLNLSSEFQHVYQLAEVDERPQILVEPKPFVPPVVRMGAKELSVTLLFVVDTTGAVASVRIARASGNKNFDDIVADCVKRQWLFSPAIKRGKKVKCLVQRAIIIRWVSNPFES